MRILLMIVTFLFCIAIASAADARPLCGRNQPATTQTVATAPADPDFIPGLVAIGGGSTVAGLLVGFGVAAYKNKAAK